MTRTYRKSRHGRYAAPKLRHTLRTAAASVAGTLAGIVIIAACTAPDEAPDMTQDAFPCAEDEVLGYAPQFGPEHVGCIHVDDLR